MTNQKSHHNLFHYLVTVFAYLAKGLIAEFIWLLVGVGGYFIFQTHKSPFDLLIGLPLMVVSIGFIINSIWSELLTVFSPKYNRAVCFFCN